MENLMKLNINLDGISFEPITNIVFILKNGAQIGIGTPLSINDFTELWETKRRKIYIMTGKESYACINKNRVDFYHIFPAKN